MKSQEFLDILGDVDEKYVLAADENVVRPKFRWQPWAVAAACAALICVAAWPRFALSSSNRGGASADYAPPIGDEPADAMEDAGTEEPADQEAGGTLVQSPGLHDYFLFEEERTLMTTAGDAAAVPAGGVDDVAMEDAPVPAPAAAPSAPGPVAGGFEDAPADIPQDVDNPYAGGAGEVQPFIDPNVAISQYQNLLTRGGINEAEGYYPEWFGGAWLDNDWPDNTARLTIAMVEGWDTEAMEAMVRDWCGGTGDVLFCTVKYSLAYLEGLKDGVAALFDRYGWLPSVIDANEVTNRVDLEIYGGIPSDEFLADLAALDPDGDAIRVQVFTDRTIQLTDDAAMEPPAPAEEPALPEPADAAPGGRTEPVLSAAPDDMEEAVPADPGVEEGQPARYGALSGELCGLPLAKPEGE